VSFRRLFVLALIAGTPGFAGAQFTTFIPPKNKVADSVKAAVVAEQKAQGDSLARVQVTNMRTWVDSAAGVTATPRTAADSLAQGLTAAATETTTFRDGTRAPATASALPFIALLGAATLLVGAFLVGGKDLARISSRSRDRA
jgi:hypothetical protein